MDDHVPHPGRILLDEVMTPLGVSRNQLARDIDVPVGRISAIVSGARAITADTALRLARYFGTTPELWMRLQADYDLARAREQIGAEIAARVRVLQARPAAPPPPGPVVYEPPAPARDAVAPTADAPAETSEPPSEAADEPETAPSIARTAEPAPSPVEAVSAAYPGNGVADQVAPEEFPEDDVLDLADAPWPDEAPEPEEDVLELSTDMVVELEPERPREPVPPIPDPPGKR
jgi:antitoxin HigA-1